MEIKSMREALKEHDDHFVSIRTVFSELAEMQGITVQEVARWVKLNCEKSPFIRTKVGVEGAYSSVLKHVFINCLNVIAATGFEGNREDGIYHDYDSGIEFDFDKIGFFKDEARNWLGDAVFSDIDVSQPPCLGGPPIQTAQVDTLGSDSAALPWAKQSFELARAPWLTVDQAALLLAGLNPAEVGSVAHAREGKYAGWQRAEAFYLALQDAYSNGLIASCKDDSGIELEANDVERWWATGQSDQQEQSEFAAITTMETSAPVPASPTCEDTSGYKERHARNREQVLGAALSVLAAFPDQCKAKRGKVLATKLREMIEEKAPLFWREGKPPLRTEPIERLVREWLKKIGE